MEDRLYTREDWAALERESPDVRYEFVHGRVIAMAGGSVRHAEVKHRVERALGTALEGRCLVAGSDLRVETVGKKVYRLPDVVAVCDEADVVEIPGVGEAIQNPTLLVEVLSESTSREDLEEKLIEYMALDSLREYWVVDPDKPRLLQYVRDAPFIAYTSEEATLRSEALGLEIALAEIYARSGPPRGRAASADVGSCTRGVIWMCNNGPPAATHAASPPPSPRGPGPRPAPAARARGTPGG